MNNSGNNFLKTEAEINEWIELNCFKNGSIAILPNDEYGFVVEVYGDIAIGRFWDSPNLNKISHVPIKFSVVTKELICSNNNLISLDFAPRFVGKDFACHDNLLTSLKGCPERVEGGFSCGSNQLTSLEGGPLYVGKGYHASSNNISTLEFIPEEIRGKIDLGDNTLLGEHQHINNFTQLEVVSNIYKQKAHLERELKNGSHLSRIGNHFKV